MSWTLRAWDDLAKKMYYATEPEQFDDAVLFRFKHFETEKPIYMRSTGWTDINGKPVYECDIVKIKDRMFRSDNEHIGYVIFEDATFLIKNEQLKLFRWFDFDVTVLGNIYEDEYQNEDAFNCEHPVVLRLSQDEADLLNDILCDASLYHHNALEQYMQLSVYEVRKGRFEDEETYHSEACDLCGKLIDRMRGDQK